MRPLALVDLVANNGELVDGLVSVHNSASVEGPHEKALVLQAAAFGHVDYVLFRRYGLRGKGQTPSSQVAAYVVDNQGGHLTEADLAKLHHELWLHGGAPLVYVAWSTRIDILSCVRSPDFWDESTADGRRRYSPVDRVEPPAENHPAAQLKTAAHIAAAFDKKRRQYSAHRLAEGTFWNDPANQVLARRDAAAHQTLIRAVVEADRDLKGESHPIRRRLLVLVILIKYLEDRAVFPAGLFGRFHAGARSIRDILRDGTVEEVRRLLAYLEDKFNGDVFSLGPEASKLTETELRRFARLAAADELGGQRHFWALFSFEHIPVSVISRLYQRFVTGRGAVYTPPLLAALLLDWAMPYAQMTGTERVLDPACGSGVFLVGAFNRLVVHWRSRHRWKRPSAKDLTRILAHSIHGVELEGGAVDLTAFSLALAVCDALEPPVIWSSLKFDKLRGRNLREGDFFDPATLASQPGTEWPDAFDVVIGNPPFDSALTQPAAEFDTARLDIRPEVPDNQSAYLFLEKGLLSLTANGTLCLIQPDGLLYNSQPAAFRRHLMRICRLRAILDFVSIRGLYDGADTKTIAWHAIGGQTRDEPVRHLTFRRTYAAAERIAFEIDHYDDHIVSRKCAETDPAVWRIGLLGGGRLYEVAARLRAMPTLADYVEGRGWDYDEGFTVGNRAKPADFLTNSPYLPTAAFTPEGIDESQITTLAETGFERRRKAELFAAPLILIKEHASIPVAFWDRGVLTYRHTIVGIHAPTNQRSLLLGVFNRLTKKRRFYQFSCAVNGTRSLVEMATAILKTDIDRLPLPDDASELELSFWEEVLQEDVLDHMADYVRLGQKSRLLRNRAQPSDLNAYATLFVRLLGSLYGNLQAHNPLFLNGLIAQPFYFGSKPDVSWLRDGCEESLHRLVYDESRQVLRTVRVVRYYGGNVVLIVKPDRLRYWIRSTAIRDADDTLAELREQGW